MRKRSSFQETSCATFFATRSNQTIYFPVAGRWRLTCYVHARKARRSLPSPDIVFTPSHKLEMVGPPTRAAQLCQSPAVTSPNGTYFLLTPFAILRLISARGSVSQP